MSFAKIAEARAVKKIVKMLRDEARGWDPLGMPETESPTAETLKELAYKIEAGEWRDVKLPTPKPKKKKVKK